MANNKAVFEIVIDDKGRLKLATKDVDNLGASVERTRKTHEKADKSARNYHNTQEKGIIGTANSTKSFSKMRETIGSGDAGLVGAYATLAANIFAVSAAFNALRSAAQAEQVMLGLEAAGSRTGRTLSVVAERVKAITNGALSMEEAARATAQVNAAGFGGDELMRLTQVANDTSFALGRSLPDAMERLTRGVTKLEPELLDELGIMVRLDDAVDTYAVRLGRSAASLTSFERRQAFMNAVLAEGEQKFGGLSGAAGDTRGYDNLGAAFSDLSKSTLNLLNDGLLPIANFLGNNQGALLGVLALFAGTIAGKIAPALGNLGKNSLAAAKDMNRTTNATASLLKQVNGVPRSFITMNEKIKEGNTSLRLFERTLREVDKSIAMKQGYINNPTRGMNVALKSLELEGIKKQRDEIQKLISSTYTYRAERSGANAAIVAGEMQLGNIMKNTRITFALLGRAHQNYTRAAIAGNNGVATSFTAVVAMAKTAKLSVIALGSAFLSLIPVVGQLYLAGTLLYSAFSWIKENFFDPAGLKEYKTEVDTLNSILEASGQKKAEYLRLQKESVNVAQNEIDKTILLGNAITEISDQLEKVRSARKALGNETVTKENILDANLSSIVNQSGTEAAVSFKSSFIKGFQNGGGITGGLGRGISDQLFIAFGSEATEGLKKAKLLATEEFKSLEAIYSLGNKNINKRILDAIEKNKKLPVAEQAEALSTLVTELERDTAPLVKITQELSSAFGELETSTSKLLTGQKISTPFDDQARALDNVTSKIAEYQIEIMKGTASTEELAKRLTEIGAQSKGLLSLEAQQARDNFVRLNAEVITLQQNLAKASKEGRGVDALGIKRQLASTISRRDAAVGGLNVISDSLNESRALTLELQRQSREYQSQLAVLQSQHSTITGIYGRTAQGLKLQYEQEERVRATKVAQLELEKTFIQNSITRQKNELISLQIQEQILSVIVMQARLQNSFQSGFEIQLAQLSLQSEALKNSIRDEESAIRNLANQQQAINNENLTDAQKQARYNERNIELANEYNSSLQEQSGIIQDLNNNIRKIQRIRSGTIATVAQEFEDLRSAALQQQKMLEAASSQKVTALRGELRKAQADADSINNRGAISETVRLLESQITNEGILLNQRKQAIDVSLTLQQLEKARFDVTKEGIEWQQKSLEIMQQQFDVSRNIQDSQNRIASARREINLKKSALVDTDEGRRAQEIQVATAAYNLARSELGLKEALIDLEYALLDAQRLALKEELTARAQYLGENSEQYEQLMLITKRLGEGSYLQLAEAQKRAARLGVEAMGEELRNLITMENPWAGSNSLLSAFVGIRELGSAMSYAKESLSKSVETAKIETNTSRDNSLPDITAPMIKEQQALKAPMVQMSEDIHAIRGFIERQLGENGGPLGSILDLMKDAEAKSLKVSEYGSKSSIHKGAGHRENRAVDINAPGGIVEANNAQYKALFDKLAKEWAKQGFVVLWNNKRYSPENTEGQAGNYGHRDHMHAEEPRGGGARLVNALRRPSVLSNGPYGTPPIHDPNQAYDAAEDQTIVVRGTRPVPANDNSSGIPTLGATALGEIDIPTITSNTTKWGTQLQLLNTHLNATLENLAQLGPEGQILSAVITGGQQIFAAIQAVGKAGSTTAEQITAYGAVASAALTMISGVVSASANARVAAIDREIDAEQRKDGQSAASVAKIQAMEKRKDQIAKKAFDTNKKIMMAQAIIATATGVAQALSYGPPGIPLAIAIGALGAAQLAIIAGTSYQSTASKTAGIGNIGKVTVGKRGDSIDLAKPNNSPGGEIGYLRGTQGQGTNSSNYTTVGRAYGGRMPEVIVGEKGPEKIDFAVPMNIKPVEANDNDRGGDKYDINIHTLDAKSVEDLFMNHGGSLIASIRNGANASGQPFLEGVSVPQLKSAAGGGSKY